MKIIIATDGSKFSRQAVENFCEFVSTKKHTDIKVISVVEPVTPITAEPFAISADYYVRVEDDMRKAAKEAVTEAEKIINDKLEDENVFVQTEVLSGNVKQTVVEEAEKFGANLIVAGSHGYGFFDRMLLGSVSDYVIHHAPCSVLIVRSENDKD